MAYSDNYRQLQTVQDSFKQLIAVADHHRHVSSVLLREGLVGGGSIGPTLSSFYRSLWKSAGKKWFQNLTVFVGKWSKIAAYKKFVFLLILPYKT